MLVVHISDTHIRNFKRHWEYKKSFEHLFESLIEKQPDIIVITGDTAHTKTQISPEFVQLCLWYFESLSCIAPLLIIPGNHDGNLNNLSRLDALTPIVEALKGKEVYYYKNSGIYPLPRALNGNIAVFSCFDDNWPTVEDVEAVRINNRVTIGLYHGFIKNAELSNGILIDDAPHVNDFLKVADYMLLGDLHKHQIVHPSFKAAYAGSYPQQNFSEDPVYKGYLLWDIKDRKEHELNFITLPNVCPFYTLSLTTHDDIISDIPENLNYQKGARIRVLSKQLTVLEKELIRNRINNIYQPREVKFLDEVNPYRQRLRLSSVDAKIEDVTEVSVQENLIKEHLRSYDLSESVYKDIFEINRRFNAHVMKQDDILRNVQYRLGKMKWSNTFSYSEDNEFDFSKRKGLVGVFGKNGSGKSSFVVDIPLYCLFNKISKKVTKNDLIINENKDSCSVGLEVCLGDDVYTILRETKVYLKSGKKTGTPVYQGKTEVGFSINGENRNSTDRFYTDLNIRKIFGTAEDFMATSVAPQWQLLNFISLGGTERQKMIGRYFGVDIFDKKHTIAKEELKDINTKLSSYKEKDLEGSMRKYDKALVDLAKQIEENDKQKEWQEKSKKRLEENIEEVQLKIENVVLDPSITEERLEEDIKSTKREVVEKREEIDSFKRKLTKNIEKVNELRAELSELDRSKLEKQFSECKFLQMTIKEVKHNKKELQKDTERLKTYPCLSNANCCMFKELKQVESSIDGCDHDIKVSERAIKKIGIDEVEKKLSKCSDLESQLEKIPSHGWEQELIQEKQKVFDALVERVEFLEKEKKNFEKNQEKIKKNLDLGIRLKGLKFRKDKVSEALQETLKKATDLSIRVTANQTLLGELEALKSEYEALKRQYKAYTHYVQVMSKDGVSKSIIADNLDVINKEMKKILSHGVGFEIELESSDGGKEIEIYFKHEKSPKRRIELCSGMEQSIAAVAIRAALINVTTLPKSNVFVLDEIFTSLDPEYMAGLTNILEYLKQLFDTVVIITHIDSFKDIVDHVIEIQRDDEGYARICE